MTEQLKSRQGHTTPPKCVFTVTSQVWENSRNTIEYTPGSSVMPVISNGAAVYGRYDINQAYNSLKVPDTIR